MAEKWKPEIKSPGDAWMDHVEKHHGASAATPGYLKPEEKGAGVQAVEKKMAELEQKFGEHEEGMEKALQKHVDTLMGKDKEQGKEQEKGKEHEKVQEQKKDIKLSR